MMNASPSPLIAHLRDALLAAALVFACTPQDGETSDGQTTASCPPGAEGCPCTVDADCGGPLICVGELCTPGGGTTTTGGASSSTVEPTTSNSDATTDPVTTTTTTTTGEDSNPTTDCEFVCEDDEFVGLISCDIFIQDCPDGEKCTPYDLDANGAVDSIKCVPAGDGLHGDPCTTEGVQSAIDSCGVGVYCQDTDNDGEGTCVAMCTGSEDDPMCEPPGTTCVISNDGVLALCRPQCSPLDQDCGPDLLCVGDPQGDGFICVPDASAGMNPEGSPCEFLNVCNPGLTCTAPNVFPAPDCMDSLGCCAPFCDLDNGDADCQGLMVMNAVCLAWYEDMNMAPMGLENTGVCGVPP